MKGKIVCCGCGATFKTTTWREDGVLGMQVNGGKRHYACKPCRDAGFNLMMHAASFTGPCSQPKVEKGVAA